MRTIHSANDTLCERLLQGGYAQLATLESTLESPSLSRLIANLPEVPFADDNYSVVLIRLDLGRYFPMQSLTQIQDLAQTSGVTMPNELNAMALDPEHPSLNISIAGRPEKLRAFLTAFREMHLEDNVRAALGVHETNMVFVKNELDPTILDLDREPWENMLATLTHLNGKIHLVNKPSSGHFFIALSPQRFEEFIQGVPQDYRQRATAKEVESLALNTLTPEALTEALSRLLKGDSQIALVQGDQTEAMLISVFDLATFQRIHAQQSAKLNVPLVRLHAEEIDGILNLAKLNLPPPPPPLPSASARVASVSQIFTKGIFREFYTSGSEWELSIARPSLLVKTRSRLSAYLLSADAVSLLSIDQIRALFKQDTGQDLPDETTHFINEYKAGRGTVDRGLHGQLWTTQGQELFNQVRTTKHPFLIVGELGERTIKPGARPRLFILPVDSGEKDGDEFEPPEIEAAFSDDEVVFPEELWEDILTHFFASEPVDDVPNKVQILKGLLASLESNPSRLTVAQYAAAKEWADARSSLPLPNFPLDLVALVNGITDRFLDLYKEDQRERPKAQRESAPVQDIFGLLRNPEAVREDTKYNLVTHKQEAFAVTFERQVIRDLFQDKALQRSLLPAFIRALRKGFIGPTEMSGIKRLTNLAQNFLEIKIPGSMSQARLIGCLEEGNTIRIHRLMYKGGSSSGGFERYKNMCD